MCITSYGELRTLFLDASFCDIDVDGKKISF